MSKASNASTVVKSLKALNDTMLRILRAFTRNEGIKSILDITKERVEYVAIWHDQYDSDYGAYHSYDTMEAAVEYLTDTVFERSEWLGVEVYDQDGNHKIMTREQVAERLGNGHEMRLFLPDGASGAETEYVSMKIDRITHICQ